MGDLKLFSVQNGVATEITGSAVAVEKSLQTLIEKSLEVFLGVRFLASEYTTTHGGRIDTLGIDENHSPVIIEYKRSTSENVMSQGLFYLDWLLDHRADFQLLVQKQIGAEAAEQIDWASPRVICIAGDFTRYDEHAVQQMGRAIELLRYRMFGDSLLALELISRRQGQVAPPLLAGGGGVKTAYKTVTEYITSAPAPLRALYDDLEAHLLALGDDVQQKTTKYYVAFRRIQNFACVEVHPQSSEILIFLKVDPDSVDLEKGFSRDMRGIGHYGTGDLELRISSHDGFDKAKPLIQRIYEES